MTAASIGARIDRATAVLERGFLNTLGKHTPSDNDVDRRGDAPAEAAAAAPADEAPAALAATADTSAKSAKSDSGSIRPADEAADDADDGDEHSEWAVRGKRRRYFGFLRSRRFYIAFVIGQIISMCLVCTNSMTTEMGNAGTSMPLFQNLLNYALLCVVYNPYMWYRYGFRKWFRILVRDSWRFFILAFIDVQGNYFVTLAYEYTNLLSASLLDNFAIVVVVILSFVFLHVRYHWSQYLGIFTTIGGMALLIVSDHLTGKDYSASDPVKGDLFVLLGAACYGFSNTFEEFLVSERPIYEVLGNLGFWAVGINGVELAIFGRKDVQNAHWTGPVGGYLTGYTLTMFLLYNLAPVMFRMSSAAFYNLNTLTSDFWSLLVGTEAFGYHVYWLYPVGFVFTIIGIVCYCAAPMSDLGEAVKPWLGEDQNRGVEGIGTARHAQEHRARRDTGSTDSTDGGDVEQRSSEPPEDAEPRASPSFTAEQPKSPVVVHSRSFDESSRP